MYIYDGGSTPIGMMYRASSANATWQLFWYEKNLQGDVVAVYDNNGVKQVSYIYDAWGNTTTTYQNGGASTGARYNPIRYRGYYYDSNLGMYWLQTRLYNPSLRRFMSPDKYVSTGQGLTGYNMYAYCGNDPVNRVDYSGEFWLGLVVLVVICALAATMPGHTVTEEQIQEAEEAADRADIEVIKEEETIEIHIDTGDAIESYNYLTYFYYVDRLYENMLAKAEEEEGVPSKNLMSKWHIHWEYNIHVVGYYFGIESCMQTDLDVKETPWTMLKRWIGI